jgi:hypothetical protein
MSNEPPIAGRLAATRGRAKCGCHETGWTRCAGEVGDRPGIGMLCDMYAFIIQVNLEVVQLLCEIWDAR